MQPPASLQALGDPIYEAFYGLKEQPFAITTDPRFFFLSAAHQRAFTELLNGLKRREGLLLVTGETGTGKTTLCRAVTESLGERTFTAMILNPYMAGAEVLRIVLRDFGLVSHEDLRRGAVATADVPQLLDTLEGFLKSLVPLGSHAIIVLDEAQALDAMVLDQIRLLTALEHEGQRLVQVILCGQPALLKTLEGDSLTALNDRITRRVELVALPAGEIDAYIQHRLAVAGGADAVTFDADAVKVIADLSRGLPRRVNVLCDRALQEGRLDGLSTITADLVKRAARALAGAHPPPAPVPAPATVAAAASVVTTTPLEAPAPRADSAPLATPAKASVPVVNPPPRVPTSLEPATTANPSAVVERPAVQVPVKTEAPALALRESAESQAIFDDMPAFEPPPSHRVRNLLVAAAVIALAAAAGYYFYAANTISTDPAFRVRAPRVPKLDVGEALTPVTVPTDEELRQIFGPAASPAPGVQPANPAAAPLQAPAPASGQAPDNRNQLN